MRIPPCVVDFLIRRLTPLSEREPDEVIGPGTRSRKTKGHVDVPKAFLIRWFVVPKNRWVNVYLHKFIRDDEDRALHDHPWYNASLLLRNSYIEHTIDAGGVHRRQVYKSGELKLRPPWAAHRVELPKGVVEVTLTGRPILHAQPISVPSWSLFITGPKQKGPWGFHCPGEWLASDDFARQGGCAKADEKLKGYPHQ